MEMAGAWGDWRGGFWGGKPLCLSQVAWLSIILPTPHWKPKHRNIVAPALNRRGEWLWIPQARA